MDATVRQALAHGRLIDITTTGRRSHAPRRIEIVSHAINGRIFISGMPSRRTRSWIHNLAADPHLTVHLKGDIEADVPATARIVTDPTERHTVFEWIARNAWRRADVEAMDQYSPLIEVIPDDLAA